MEPPGRKIRRFGPKPPPLLVYLKGVLRGYSDGQILKELLQNAEDAGATKVQFIYDQRQFGTRNLLEPSIGIFQGPAIYAYNNALFTKDDWDGIQNPSRSKKQTNAQKVGRFGIGFSSVYHITDFPCILSGDEVAFIDPTEDHFHDEKGKSLGPGRQCSLQELAADGPDQFDSFCNVIPDLQNIQHTKHLDGTLFRFPLRTKPSDLCRSVYREMETMKLLDAFQQDADIAMLFLHNIEEVSIFCKRLPKYSPEQILRVSLTQNCLKEIRKVRKGLRKKLEKFKPEKSDIQTNVVMNIEMKTATENKRQTWVVSELISCNDNKQIVSLTSKLNFMPWVGVAILISETDNIQACTVSKEMDGRTFCFLPLPPGCESLSGLPVHVHGYFGVSDDRRSLKWPGEDRVQNEDACWNQLLVQELLPNVYINAVKKAVEEVSRLGLEPDCVYNAFPNLEKELDHWRSVAYNFYENIFDHTVIYHKPDKTWIMPKNATFVDQSLGRAIRNAVIKGLRKSGYKLIDDLPTHIMHALKKYHISKIKFLDRHLILDTIRTDRDFFIDYSRQEQLFLLEYLLTDGATASELDGVQLLPISDGKFTKWIQNPSFDETVFVETDFCPKLLLPNQEHKFLLTRGTSNVLQQHFKRMVSSNKWKQVNDLDPSIFLKLLPMSLPPAWRLSDEKIVKWKTSSPSSNLPADWLDMFWNFAYQYLSTDDKFSQLQGLKLLPITPTNSTVVKLVSLGKNSRLISLGNTECEFKNIVSLMKYLGALVFNLPPNVCKHPEIFNYVHKFTPDELLKLLQMFGQNAILPAFTKYQQTFIQDLLPYLSRAKFNTSDISFFRTLSIFPATSDLSNTLSQSNVCINSEISLLDMPHELPNIKLPQKIMVVTCHETRKLLNKLRVPKVTSNEMLLDILTKASTTFYSTKEKQELMKWICSRYEKYKPEYIDLMRKISFVPNGLGDCLCPSQLLEPTTILKKLFQDSSLFPSADVTYPLKLLKAIGLKTETSVTGQEILNVSMKLKSNSIEQAEGIIEFLSKYPHLLESTIHTKKLCAHLQEISFIPCKVKRPSFYPKRLPWFSSSHSLFKPTEVIASENEDTHWIVGSVCPITSNLKDKTILSSLHIKQMPPIPKVIKQLELCSKSHNEKVLNVFSKIYDFLEEHINTHFSEISNLLPKEWVWTGNCVVDVSRVYQIESTNNHLDLRPYVFVIPRELRQFKSLFSAMKVQESIETDETMLVNILRMLSKNKKRNKDENRKDTNLALSILRHITTSGTDEDFHNYADDILVPTTSSELKLLKPCEVCYIDTKWLDHKSFLRAPRNANEDPIELAHEQIPMKMAEKLKLVPLSRKLAKVTEIEGIKQSGQHEPITMRIKNLLRNGYQATSLPKEMVQNAEDAGATEVKFVLDLRSNSDCMTTLLDPKMKDWQGEALWVYNDATFSDSDLTNITKLGGATKEEQRTKIGKFGLGFNSVYHITDVPSFVTRHVVTFFDPHEQFLQRICSGRGIQIDLRQQRHSLANFKDQFFPYNGIFGCKLGENGMLNEFSGTLFRLPLRKKIGDISNELYDESKIKPLIESLCANANQMLFFTENVQTISFHIIKQGMEAKNMKKLFEVQKQTEVQNPPLHTEFKTYVTDNMTNFNWLQAEMTVVQHISLKCFFSTLGKRYFDCYKVHEKQQNWIVVMATGPEAIEISQSEQGNKMGLLPCGGVAYKCGRRSFLLRGNVFCFLPLPLPSCNLPVHINASFAISNDRQHLWRGKNDIRSNWNVALLKDVIVRAYIVLINEVNVNEVGVPSSSDQDMFHLWPNPENTPIEGDYGILVTEFYKAVVHGIGDIEPPSMYKTASGRHLKINQLTFVSPDIQNNESLFTVVIRALESTGNAIKVIELPGWVRSGFGLSGVLDSVEKCTFNQKRFLKEVLIPNIQNLIRKDVHTLICHYLNSDDPDVFQILKESECIPSSPHGDSYTTPANLLDPNKFKDLFSESEGVFPHSDFLTKLNTRQKGSLSDIGGLNSVIDWTKVVERARTIKVLWQSRHKDTAMKRIQAILKYIDEKIKSEECPLNLLRELKKVPFLPAKLQDRKLEIQPSESVFLKQMKDLVYSVHYILEESSSTIKRMSNSLQKFFGLDGKKPKVTDVLTHFRYIINRRQHRNLLETCSKIYTFLETNLDDREMIYFIAHESCFLIENRFFNAKSIAFGGQNVLEHLCKVPYSLERYKKLLKAAGVRERFELQDYIDVLCDIKEKYKENPLKDDLLSCILNDVVPLIVNVIEQIQKKGIAECIWPNEDIIMYLPDKYGVMRKTSDLAFCDVDWVDDPQVNVCHHKISFQFAKILEIKDIRQQVLSQYLFPLPSAERAIGTEFGQRELLTTRIKRILSGYPCDFSILKEIVQNADDAGASEVHFIIDSSEHGTKRLFKNEMSELQGPALLAYNNKAFSKEDIEGIQRLGEGSKAPKSTKIGRYGVGFNIVYHLTDCPMLLSNCQTLCILDPTLQYAPGASSSYPGRLIEPIDTSITTMYSDAFQCFLKFQKNLNLQKGTLFRFPLRKGKGSEISKTVTTVQFIRSLFESFKAEMFDVFLFLQNVKCIKLSECSSLKGELRHTYQVEASTSGQNKQSKIQFYDRLAYHAKNKTPLKEIEVVTEKREITIVDSCKKKEKWIVHQRLGIKNIDMIPKHVEFSFNQGELKMLPKGGVAAQIYPHVNHRKKKYKAFCFLPLPGETDLPLHIDGYFALDHESRRNLWKGPTGDVRSDWNTLICDGLIGPTYAEILGDIKQFVSDEIEKKQNCTMSSAKYLLQNYHSFFPVSNESHWNCVKESFYKCIMKERYSYFPVIQEVQNVCAKRKGVKASTTSVCINLKWVNCTPGSENSGYFDDLETHFAIKEPIHRQGLSRVHGRQDYVILRNVLLRLAFPLISSPLSIYNCLLELTCKTVEPLKVHPENVILFLNAKLFENVFPRKIEESVISSERDLVIILKYIKQAEHYENKLLGTPLLLTSDQKLRYFDTNNRVFHSKHHHLLPRCNHEFLDNCLLEILPNTMQTFQAFRISDFSSRISTELSNRFQTHTFIKAPKLSSAQQQWFNSLWHFLADVTRKGQICHTKYCNDILQLIGKWAVLPAKSVEDHEVTQYLVPLQLGKTVLRSLSFPANPQLESVLKKLECPTVDYFAFFQSSKHSSYPTYENVLNHFVSSFEYPADILKVIKRILDDFPDNFSKVCDNNRQYILQYFNNTATYLTQSHENKDALLKLPCYETVNDNFTSLSGASQVFAISNAKIPQIESGIWLKATNVVFLKGKYNLARLFNALDITELDETSVYKKFILPFFHKFSSEAMRQHLLRIRKLVNEDRENTISRMNLMNTPLLSRLDGSLGLVSDFYDPELEIFRVMLTHDAFPAKPYSNVSWLPFLRHLGLKSVVNCDDFLKFVYLLAQEECTADRENRSKMLLSYLFRHHDLHQDYLLLEKVSSIAFLPAASLIDDNLLKIHEQCQTQHVTCGAIPYEFRVLVWSACPFLPSWFNKMADDGSCNVACIEICKKKLKIAQKPSISHVIEHTKNICQRIHTSSESSRRMTQSSDTIQKVIVKILRFLYSECLNDEHCTTLDSACTTCESIFDNLDGVNFVPDDNGHGLSETKMVTKHIPKTGNEHLHLYIKEIPDDLVPYSPLLFCLGATKEPSLGQYANVLAKVFFLCNENAVSNPNIMAAAEEAMHGFFRCLDLPSSSQELKKISRLYLLTEEMKKPLRLSSEIFYNDVPQYRKRLLNFSEPMLIPLKQKDFHYSHSPCELMLKIPEQWRPFLAHEHIKEDLVTDLDKEACRNCCCPFVLSIRNILSWGQISCAIKCIANHEKEKTKEEIHKQVTKITSALFQVECVKEIKTILTFQGNRISGSQHDKNLYMTKLQNENLLSIYVSKTSKNSALRHHLAIELNQYLDNLLVDIAPLVSILHAENENEIEKILNDLNICTDELEEPEQSWRPELGADIPDDIKCWLDQDITIIFREEEFVAYNENDNQSDEEEHLIYAQIKERRDIAKSAFHLHSRYKIDTGQDEVIEVAALSLFKFLWPDDFPPLAIVPYTAEHPTPSNCETFEYNDLEAAKEKVSEQLREIWNLPESKRRTALRRLLRTWHPDKHLQDRKALAEAVFKHIQTEIKRLEQEGGTSQRWDTFQEDVDKWARQTNQQQRSYRSNFTFYSQNQQRRGYSSSRPPPSFQHKHKANFTEAKRWFSQAERDLKATSFFRSRSYDSYEWSCTQLYCAVEKALMAVLFRCGLPLTHANDIEGLATTLKHELDISTLVSQITNIIPENAHSPKSCRTPDIPHEIYTAEIVRIGREITEKILQKIKTFLDDF